MNKEEILKIMEDEYKEPEIMGAVSDAELSMKLLETTKEFARSFDYELPIEYGVKGKFKRFIKRIIRKSTRFITKPYAEQMLKFQESLCELEGMQINKISKLELECNELQQKLQEHEMALYNLTELQQKLQEHEAALYNLTEAFNDNANLTLELSNSNADIKQYLFGGEDNAFRGYAQAGEDAVISFILSYLGEKKQGCSYLDIGCNDYKKLSNTYHFYEQGMRGVLVDANPKFVEQIKDKRPEDVVLNVGVGAESSDSLKFYILNGDGLSSFNKQTVDEAIKETSWLKIEKEIDVPVITINEIFQKYFYTVPTIVSIDIEGDELAILESIDMEKYRPLIYIIETIEYRQQLELDNKRNDIIEYMKTQGYREYAFTGVNSIFLDERQFVKK